MAPRIGIGDDLHRLEPGDGLVLGTVAVPCAVAAVAHSDGDVLLHAITDAILGAIGGPDIGDLFPDRDDINRDRPSIDFLHEALRRASAAGYSIGNLDATVMLERPRLGEAKQEIRQRVAAICTLSVDAVSIKAKSGEKVGPVGEGRAIAARAAVLLLPAGEESA